MITIRLPDELENQLLLATEIEQKTKTEIVKAALAEYFERHLQEKSAYELGRDVSSGERDLSTTYKKRLKKRLDEKYSH